jgi:hypothetical protein
VSSVFLPGAVNEIPKLSCASSGTDPPSKTISLPVTDVVQPSLSTGAAFFTPFGTRKVIFVVGEPSQPCSGVNATVASDPGFTRTGSGSTWAPAGPATRATTAPARTPVTVMRRAMRPVLLISRAPHVVIRTAGIAHR